MTNMKGHQSMQNRRRKDKNDSDDIKVKNSIDEFCDILEVLDTGQEIKGRSNQIGSVTKVYVEVISCQYQYIERKSFTKIMR